MTSSSPAKGQMVLYSSATPPLPDGSYQLTVETDVTYQAGDPTAIGDTPPSPLSQDHYFDIVGPRFSVPAAMVAGCFPPRNAHGAFQDDLPHIVIARRTLPWERQLAPKTQLPGPPTGPKDAKVPALTDPYPWVALLLFEEGEYTWLPNIALEQVVPTDVFTALGKPANITCDAVEADTLLIESIMPSYEELQLLVHVRQVNTEDRELNAYGGDGFFSVVVSNRLPAPNAQCRAVLVSLEQRLDVIPTDRDRANPAHPNLIGSDTTASAQAANAPYTLSTEPVHAINSSSNSRVAFASDNRVRLVALTSWQFTCEGPGSFRDLMAALDDAMFGTVVQPCHPPVTDTGHIPLTVADRAGATENVLYRGPLVQYPLTRDPLGPYHSADQARRVAPESGTEDISYACAFEVGRLLAAADGRLAQAMMRWRREAYQQSARLSTITAAAQRVALNLPATTAEQLHTPVVARAAAAATTAVVQARPLPGDPYGLGRVANTPGLSLAALAAAWQLASPQAAAALLGADPGTLGTPATPPSLTARADTTLDAVAADAAGLARLGAARTQAIDNATALLEGT
jgi:hypothetical protein